MSDSRPTLMTKTVLFLEDDVPLGERVRALLESDGFSVVWWRRGREVTAADVREVDLVVLDLMLPGTHGLDVLSSLREAGHRDLPVIVLSGLDDGATKVRALRLGADDYVTKPFWPEELVERVRARLRRPAARGDEALTVGALRIDPAAQAAFVDEQRVELTRIELAIAIALARRAGEALPRKELARKVLDPERDPSERALDVHVSNLRKKLGDSVRIETVWGVGYRLPRVGSEVGR